LGHTTNLRSIPFGYPLHLFVQDHQVPLLHFLEPSQLKKLMKGPADTTTVNVDTLREAFLNTSLSCAFFIDQSSFLVKNKTSGFGTTVVK
jgi:hypothetical protein